MSITCWKTIGYRPLSQSLNTLEYFDGRGSRSYVIIKAFPILLEGKMVTMEVEVVDANLNYNIPLGRSWTNTMVYAISTLFCVLIFPHQGKIVVFDQLDFFPYDSSAGNIPYVWKATTPYDNIG